MQSTGKLHFAPDAVSFTISNFDNNLSDSLQTLSLYSKHSQIIRKKIYFDLAFFFYYYFQK